MQDLQQWQTACGMWAGHREVMWPLWRVLQTINSICVFLPGVTDKGCRHFYIREETRGVSLYQIIYDKHWGYLTAPALHQKTEGESFTAIPHQTVTSWFCFLSKLWTLLTWTEMEEVWVFKEQLTESWSVWRRAELVFMVGFIHFIHDNLSMLPCMSRNTIPLTADIANLLLCMCHIPSPWPIQIFVVSWLISSMWKTSDALTAWLLITSQMNKCGQFSSYLCWILIQQVCRNHLQCITFEGEPSNCFDENNNFSSLHTGGEGVCCLVKEQCNSLTRTNQLY